MGNNYRVPLAPILDAFGVDATVAVPWEPPVTTSIIWIDPSSELRPGGGELQRSDQHRICLVPRSDVPKVPLQTVITAPGPTGGEAKEWTVDGFETSADDEDDHARVVVLSKELFP